MQIHNLLKTFGLNDKEIAVYTTLISLGPSPVRLIAQNSKVNRGTTYDILKSLMADGLVSYFNKATKQYFIAEPPEKLLTALENKEKYFAELKATIIQNLPELQALYTRQGEKPQVRLYEGVLGVRQILEDVLTTMAARKEKTYYVYSSASVRSNVYKAMPDFSNRRIVKKIKVRTISLGPGGQLTGLDERKWIPDASKLKATYEIIYGGKVAHISLDAGNQPVGVVIENSDIYQTQKMIFEFNWNQL